MLSDLEVHRVRGVVSNQSLEAVQRLGGPIPRYPPSRQPQLVEQFQERRANTGAPQRIDPGIGVPGSTWSITETCLPVFCASSTNRYPLITASDDGDEDYVAS